MSTPSDADNQLARAKRRQRRQSRQAIIFGVLILGMVVSAGVGALVASETVTSPFKRNYAIVKTEKSPPAPWCPTGEMVAIDPSQITVSALNGTQRSLLAKKLAEDLEGLGFVIAGEPTMAQNAQKDPTKGTIEIYYGPSMANQALTIAEYFPDAKLWADDRTSDIIDVVAGKLYNDPYLASDIEISAGAALKAPTNCRQVPASDDAPPADNEAPTDDVPAAE